MAEVPSPKRYKLVQADFDRINRKAGQLPEDPNEVYRILKTNNKKENRPLKPFIVTPSRRTRDFRLALVVGYAPLIMLAFKLPSDFLQIIGWVMFFYTLGLYYLFWHIMDNY